MEENFSKEVDDAIEGTRKSFNSLFRPSKYFDEATPEEIGRRTLRRMTVAYEKANPDGENNPFKYGRAIIHPDRNSGLEEALKNSATSIQAERRYYSNIEDYKPDGTLRSEAEKQEIAAQETTVASPETPASTDTEQPERVSEVEVGATLQDEKPQEEQTESNQKSQTPVAKGSSGKKTKTIPVESGKLNSSTTENEKEHVYLQALGNEARKMIAAGKSVMEATNWTDRKLGDDGREFTNEQMAVLHTGFREYKETLERNKKVKEKEKQTGKAVDSMVQNLREGYSPELEVDDENLPEKPTPVQTSNVTEIFKSKHRKPEPPEVMLQKIEAARVEQATREAKASHEQSLISETAVLEDFDSDMQAKLIELIGDYNGSQEKANYLEIAWKTIQTEQDINITFSHFLALVKKQSETNQSSES